ncbi:hypothetical protein [Bacteroides sp.]|uniref:hypothetical protein n=1 Tax=Bacteroides sp. TaxID=29523 RepID=UPI0026180493|nr:hypothetical protein [Bacteroides sp.]
MRNLIIVLLLLSASFLSAQETKSKTLSFNNSLRIESEKLLTEWMDTFLTYQLDNLYPSLYGGVLCPACARIHGRIGDAVLPLMYLAEKTRNDKYLSAAKRLMAWMENVHLLNGSWMNDVHVSDWNGTTVFASIALYEALHYHGHLLDDSTRNHWKQRLIEAGEFMMATPFIYSRKRDGMRNMNVNYQASATYALYAIGEMCNRPDFQKEARQVADDLKSFFTENDAFLFGEGPNVWSKTRNGCLPIDLLYNVEESLPNMVYYGIMAKDTELLALVDRSMATHLEFMLPDGAWDNSWGTRSFKWTYWGGRTSDGFMGGYYAMAAQHPEYLEAIRRNVQLLKEATSDGLLYGGMHYRACGIPPCIHHTFGHAKAITSFLELPSLNVTSSKELPRDKAYGMKYFKDIHTWLISQGAWRATFTGYDAEYKTKGTHPMGGALSMLWHAQAGPIFAATMNQYQLIEAPNMQSNSREYIMGGTPRIELMQNGNVYSNLDDLNTDIICHTEKNGYRFAVNTHLVDINQKSPSQGEIPITLDYTYTKQGIGIIVDNCYEGAYFMLPVIASPTEEVKVTSREASIKKRGGILSITCTAGCIEVAPTDKDGRIFNPVPGFSFVPLRVIPDGAEKKICINILFR